MRELQLSSNAIWQMIYWRMVFTNPNNPVCGSIVSLLIMQLSWLNPSWLTQGYQQHSTIGCLKLEQLYRKGCAKFIVPLPILSIFLEFDVPFSFSSWFYSLQIYLGFSPFNSTLTRSSDGSRAEHPALGWYSCPDGNSIFSCKVPSQPHETCVSAGK